ncbi:MAG: winged helix-turn-helix domain-containing protein [Paracoccaceae bacterium]
MALAERIVLIAGPERARSPLFTQGLRGPPAWAVTIRDTCAFLADPLSPPAGAVVLDLSGCEGGMRVRLPRALAMLRARRVPVLACAPAGAPDTMPAASLAVDHLLEEDAGAQMLQVALRAMLRREKPASFDQALVFDGLQVSEEARRATFEGCDIRLGPKEFLLLCVLMEAPHRVWTRAALRALVWGPRATISERTIDKVASRLRSALQAATGRALVESVSGEGYRLGSR